MFEGLRKKFSNFIGGLAKKEEEEVKEAEKVEEAKQEPKKVEETQEVKVAETQEKEAQASEPTPETEDERERRKQEERRALQEKQALQGETGTKRQPLVGSPGHGINTVSVGRGVKYTTGQPVVPQKPKIEDEKKIEEPKAPQPQQPKVTFTTKLKSVIFSQVKISDKDADPFIESLKIDLLESDVNYDVAEKIAASIRAGLVGKSVDSKNITGEIANTIRGSIMQVLSSRPQVNMIRMINQKKDSGDLPFKIMFIGPNGAGKTTTMAKIASMLLANNITCVLSASDTFRAAAIEQTVIHAERLGVNVIKGSYGADPSSVAFDAIAHAKAHGIFAVLIDSAGRQETNKSLIEELKKMTRVTAPDLKIFVGEAISGNALLEQVKAINEAVKIDGIILTKLDVDAKGGNTLSILSDTQVPILFFGTGEKYTDIIPYDPKFIVDNIMPNN